MPPIEWSEGNNILWKVAIDGNGSSTPIIWEDKVFVLTAVDTGNVAPSLPRPEDQPERVFGIKYPNTTYRFWSSVSTEKRAGSVVGGPKRSASRTKAITVTIASLLLHPQPMANDCIAGSVPQGFFATAERAIKSSLLRASGFDITALPVDTLTDAIESGNQPGWFRAWGWGARALLAYRSGDADSAVKYVAKSEEHTPSEFGHAMNLAVVAMAQYELGQLDEARMALAGASQLITRLKENLSNQGHTDLLIAEILFREAEAKIGGKAEPRPPGTAPAPAPADDKTPPAGKPGAESDNH